MSGKWQVRMAFDDPERKKYFLGWDVINPDGGIYAQLDWTEEGRVNSLNIARRAATFGGSDE